MGYASTCLVSTLFIFIPFYNEILSSFQLSISHVKIVELVRDFEFEHL